MADPFSGFREAYGIKPTAEDVDEALARKRAAMTHAAPDDPGDRLREMALAQQKAREDEVLQALRYEPPPAPKAPPSSAQKSLRAGESARARAIAGAREADQMGTVVSRDNPMRQPALALTGSRQVVDETRADAMQSQQEYERRWAADYAAWQDEVAQRKRDLSIDRQAEEMDRAERIAQARDAEMRAAKLHTASVQQLQDAQQVSPDIWADKSAGFKARAVIGGFLAQLGGDDVPAHFRALAQQQMEANKANLDKARSVVDARAGAIDQARAMRQRLIAEVQDERVVDSMETTAWMEAMLAQLDARQAELGIQQLTPAQQLQRAALVEEIAQRRFQDAQLLAATPARISRRVGGPGRLETFARKKAIEQDIETGAKLTEGAFEQEGDLEMEAAKQRGAIAKEEAKARGAKAGKITEKEAAWRGAMSALDRWEQKYPDASAWGKNIPNTDAAAADEELDLIIESGIAGITGAVASEQQIEKFEKFKPGRFDTAATRARKLRGLRDYFRAMKSGFDPEADTGEFETARDVTAEEIGEE